MKKFRKLVEQHREAGRFKPTIPRIVRGVGVGPRPDVDSSDAKLKEATLDKSTPTVEEIAKKHNVSIEAIEKELQMGLKIEKEHTTKDSTAREIALDHLSEKPNYYSKLKKYVEMTDVEYQSAGSGAKTLVDKPNREPMKTLKQFNKKSSLQEAKKDEREYDYEGEMVKSDLRSIIANSNRLIDMLDDEDNLPEWCQNKITLAEDYISTVANYMTAEMNEEKENVHDAIKKIREEETDRESEVKKNIEQTKKTFPNVKHFTKSGHPDWKKHGYKDMPVKEETEQIDEIIAPIVAGAGRVIAAGAAGAGRVIGKVVRNTASTAGKAVAGAVANKVVNSAMNKSGSSERPKTESVEQIDEISTAQMSHQGKTTLKHIKNPGVELRMAAHDVKPGTSGYRDRIDLLKAAKAQGKLKEDYNDASERYKRNFKRKELDFELRHEVEPQQRKSSYSADKIYHNVPFAKKDDAKKEGMRFDGEKKKWYHTNVHASRSSKFQREMHESEQIDELSTELLGRYKKAAGTQASAADKAKDFAKGNKRFSGIVKATKKQFANDSMKKEEVEYLEEKNKPTNPELWSRAVSMAKQKFDVYPSAYANGWAAKWYKSKGGGWKSVSEEVDLEENQVWKGHSSTVKNPNFNDELSIRRVNPVGKRLKSGKLSADERGSQDRLKTLMQNTKKKGGLTGPKDKLPEEVEQVEEQKEPPFEPSKTTKKAIPGKHGSEYSTVRHLARTALKRQAEKMKPVKESLEESRKAEIVKEIVKKKKNEMSETDKFVKDPILSDTISKE